MRVKSKETNGYVIYAVSGTNTISFAIDFRKADIKGLLGFAVERINKRYGERKYMDGFKVFKEIISEPTIEYPANTYSHPVQSFVWDDYACYDDTAYEYLFYPLKGAPANIDRSAMPVKISVSTEPAFSNNEHDVFFNRGVASSQVYSREFFNVPPDEEHMNPFMLDCALKWLSRNLDEAILKFINQANAGDTLLGCFYEFHYLPVLNAFKKAIDRGVKVRLIIDAKNNGDGKKVKSFPREANLEALKKAGITLDKKCGYVIKREAKKKDIQHNKFIVLIEKLKGNEATQVWTGSTNISNGGIHGQTNVGHWVRDSKAAKKYQQYWEVLSKDPGGKESDDRSTALKKNNVLKKEIENLQQTIEFKSRDDIPMGITPVFSPRTGTEMLESYFKLMDSAENLSCITLAFGINSDCKKYLRDNTAKNHITFILLEKEDKPNEKSKAPFVNIGVRQNVYEAWGSYISDSLFHWVKETNTNMMGLNSHVSYIHSKFLLVDPLGSDPIIVSGSANFSDASTECNDENMIIIRGNKRAADIYFTEFNRLFNHYYFRSIYNKLKNKSDRGQNDMEQNVFLVPDDSWLVKYKPGSFRYKRVEMIAKMEGVKEE